jgi:hypothetical protein
MACPKSRATGSRQAGLCTTATVHSGIFCGLAGVWETFFTPFWRARRTIAKSGGYMPYRMTGVWNRERDDVTCHLTGARGFMKARLRTGSPMLMSPSRPELACSGVRDESRRSSLHSSCVWRVKTQLWCCVKIWTSMVLQLSKGHILWRDFPHDAGLLASTVPVRNLRLYFGLT